jgi:hypothetical protein
MARTKKKNKKEEAVDLMICITKKEKKKPLPRSSAREIRETSWPIKVFYYTLSSYSQVG